MPNKKPDYEKMKLKLQAAKAKLRAATKLVINTETGVVTALPIIEIKLPNHPTHANKYLPLNIAGTWEYKTEAARDKVLAALKAA